MKNIKAIHLSISFIIAFLLLPIHAFGQFENILYNFQSSNGDAEVPTKVVQGPDGWLYGSTTYGGTFGGGAIFKVSTNGTGYMVLHSFDTNSALDGAFPLGGIVVTPDGWVCGTT